MSNAVKFLPRREVLSRIRMSKAAFYERLNPKSPRYDPSFPRPVRLSDAPNGAVRWIESEVVSWMLSRANARTQPITETVTEKRESLDDSNAKAKGEVK